MRIATQEIGGRSWLVIAVLALLPGSFVLLPVYSWLLARRAPQPVRNEQ